MQIDPMLVKPLSGNLILEELPTPHPDFLFTKVTLPEGKGFVVIDPESKQELLTGNPISVDNSDYVIVGGSGNLPVPPVPGLLFQYIVEGSLDVHRLPSEGLNHGSVKYTTEPKLHTVRGNVNVQLLAGFKEYTASVGSDCVYMCVTMPDYYECHVQNDEVGAGIFFPLEPGKFLRVVI